MRPFVITLRGVGKLSTRIVTYAGDLVILCRRGNAAAAQRHLRELMGKLKLTVNEEKTRICRVPDSHFDFLGYYPLIAHRMIEDHAENGERLVDRATAELHLTRMLLRAGFCETGFRFQQTSDERLFDRLGNPRAELGAKTFNVGDLDQAERAVTEIGDEIAAKELLVAAPRGGSNPDLALEPAIGCVLESKLTEATVGN